MAGLVTSVKIANANSQIAYASRTLPNKQYLGPNFTLVPDPAQRASYNELHTLLCTFEKAATDDERPLCKRTEILLKALYPQPTHESAPLQATAEKVDQKALSAVHTSSEDCTVEALRLQRELTMVLTAIEHVYIFSHYLASQQFMYIEENWSTIPNPLVSFEHRRTPNVRAKACFHVDALGYYVIQLKREKLTSLEAIAFICRWSKIIDPDTLTIKIKDITQENLEDIKLFYNHPVEEIRIIARIIHHAKGYEKAKSTHAPWITKLMKSMARLNKVADTYGQWFTERDLPKVAKVMELAKVAKSKTLAESRKGVEQVVKYSPGLFKDLPAMLLLYKQLHSELHGLRSKFAVPVHFFAYDKRTRESFIDGMPIALPHPEKLPTLYAMAEVTAPKHLCAFFAFLRSPKGQELLSCPDLDQQPLTSSTPASEAGASLSLTSASSVATKEESFASSSMPAKSYEEPLDDRKDLEASSSLTARSKEPVPDEKEAHVFVSAKKTVTLRSITDQVKLTAKTLTFAPRIYDQADWKHDFPIVACFKDTPYAIQIQQLNEKTGKMDTRHKFFGQVVIKGKKHRGVFEVTVGGLDGKTIHHFFTPKPPEEFVNEILRKSWDKVDYPSLEVSAKMTAGAKPIEFTVPDFDKVKFRLDPYFQSVHFVHGRFAITLLMPQRSYTKIG